MTHKEMWDVFAKNNNLTNEKYNAWDFGDTPDELAELALKGIKTSTSSAYAYYEIEGLDLPKSGQYSVVLNSTGEAVCIIMTTKVSIIHFYEIGEKEAIDEGDGTLENWRSIHRRYFGDYLRANGLEFSEDMLIVYEDFVVVYK